MSMHSEDKHFLPPTLESKRQDDHSMRIDDQPHYRQKEEPLKKDYLSTRQLPALDSLNSHQQNDDYIRIKLSGMSVGVSPNLSPRGQHEQRGDYFPHNIERRDSKGLVYDPIRASSNKPLIRRIMDPHQEPTQRRHSIANLDLNRRSSSTSNLQQHHYHHQNEPTNNMNTQNNTLYHQQNHHFLHNNQGHYSAPSSPPLSFSKTSFSTATKPLFSPYNRLASKANYLEDDSSPPPPQMRRNSSALLYRNSNGSRRMSSSSSSTSSFHRVVGNQANSIKQEEEEEEEMIINKEQRDEMEGIYSRSPELRVSHKLAERKRRKEMKDLFEELKDALPVDKSIKTSKWEILSKAVEYIGILRHRDYNMEQELVMLRHKLESLKNEKAATPTPPQYHKYQ